MGGGSSAKKHEFLPVLDGQFEKQHLKPWQASADWFRGSRPDPRRVAAAVKKARQAASDPPGVFQLPSLLSSSACRALVADLWRRTTHEQRVHGAFDVTIPFAVFGDALADAIGGSGGGSAVPLLSRLHSDVKKLYDRHGFEPPRIRRMTPWLARGSGGRMRLRYCEAICTYFDECVEASLAQLDIALSSRVHGQSSSQRTNANGLARESLRCTLSLTPPSLGPDACVQHVTVNVCLGKRGLRGGRLVFHCAAPPCERRRLLDDDDKVDVGRDGDGDGDGDLSSTFEHAGACKHRDRGSHAIDQVGCPPAQPSREA